MLNYRRHGGDGSFFKKKDLLHFSLAPYNAVNVLDAPADVIHSANDVTSHIHKVSFTRWYVPPPDSCCMPGQCTDAAATCVHRNTVAPLDMQTNIHCIRMVYKWL